MLLLHYSSKTGLWKKTVNAPAKRVQQQKTETPCKKPRKEIKVLYYTLPSKPAVSKMVRDFALISYRDMAESIAKDSEQGKVVSYGNNDTVKAAGNKRLDVKTVAITVIGEEKQSEIFSSGFFQILLTVANLTSRKWQLFWARLIWICLV